MSKLVRRINEKRYGGEDGSYKAPVRKHSETSINWVRVDCSGMALGRISSKIARILSGKDDPQYTPNVRAFGVICENIDNVILTGKKVENTTFFRHTGYLGGLKEFGYEDMSSVQRLRKTVAGMIDKKTYLHKNIDRFLKFEGDI